MNDKTSNKPISFSEFKFWLQGVEEMQEPGWAPSPAQWTKIKEKLESVNVTLDRPPSELQYPPGVRTSAPAAAAPRARPPEPVEYAVDQLDTFTARQQPQVPGGAGYNSPFK